MQKMSKWIERKFPVTPPPGEFPMIVERLRGTPDRVAMKLVELPRERLVARPGEDWSIQEHVGHLLDVEPLWLTRLEDLLAGAEVLTAADMSNRRTHEASHNERRLDELVAGFREARGRLVDQLDGLDEAGVVASALHPRLKQPMRTIDLCLFVAEHDDHHLAIITRLMREHPRR